MESRGEIVNRVSKSNLVTINLEEFYQKGERIVYDIKDNLYNGMILREKDFRAFVKEYDWSQYKDTFVAVHCSVDAIVPTWAYMLLASKLEPYANMVVFGTIKTLEEALFRDAINNIDLDPYKDAKVVIKGCGDLPVPEYAYVEITRILKPVVSSIMYGEPCSTVPIYKKKR